MEKATAENDHVKYCNNMLKIGHGGGGKGKAKGEMSFSPLPNAQCPMPNAQYFDYAQYKCPMPYALCPIPQ